MSITDWQNKYLFANTNRITAFRTKHLVDPEPYGGALCGADINTDSIRDSFPTDARVCRNCEKIARERAA